MKTATFVRDVDWSTPSSLYELSETVSYPNYGPTPGGDTSYVIVTSRNHNPGGPKTQVYPATVSGRLLNPTPLRGSYHGGLSHETALTNAGFTLIDGVPLDMEWR